MEIFHTQQNGDGEKIRAHTDVRSFLCKIAEIWIDVHHSTGELLLLS